jgi:hypothetical protein
MISSFAHMVRGVYFYKKKGLLAEIKDKASSMSRIQRAIRVKA